MDRNQDKHRLSIADMITLLRIAGTILLLFFPALSPAFFILYALTGLTDVLDGWIARRTKTASDFGARLDSVADLPVFYILLLIQILQSHKVQYFLSMKEFHPLPVFPL